MMLEFFNYLNNLHPLSAEVTAMLMKVAKMKELRKGQVWLQEGAACDRFTFVVKGLMKLYFEAGPKEVVIALYKENECLLPAQSFFNHKSASYSVSSVEPSVLLYFTTQELQQVLARCPEMYCHLYCIIQKQCIELERHTELLLLPARDRLDKLTLDNSWLASGDRISDKMLAAYLGVGANAVWKWKR